MEIPENNKLIAVFEGWEMHPSMPQTMQVKEIEQGFRKLSDFCFIEDLSYHKDWNELMRVVEKIESFSDNFMGSSYNVNIESLWVEIINNRTSDTIVKADADTKIESVYLAVVKFIKWYNKQNK